MGVFQEIPACLTLCVVVMTFACLKRHTRCAHLTLWAVGWTFVFIHYLAQLLEPSLGKGTPLLLAIDLGALQAAAIAFLVSVSSVVEDRGKRNLLIFSIGLPSVAYGVLDACAITSRWPYCVCLCLCFCAASLFLLRDGRKFSFYGSAVATCCFLAAAWTVRLSLNGSFHAGELMLLGLGFALSGLLLLQNFSPKSPALLAISGGFLCWSGMFVAPLFLHRVPSGAILPDALGDTPKLIVALGMILAVVEQKSTAIIRMQHKARSLSQQLERFSAFTSRLLSNDAPEAVCPDIATAITELSSFPAALIHLETQEGTLRLAGSSARSKESLRRLQDRTQEWSVTQIQGLCGNARQAGKMSFVFDSESGSTLLIPLRSASGAFTGSITLEACAGNNIKTHELTRIESLAADLAVAVELKSLHSQLVWSEKLAAMGQLVAGVAHELNNPLTAIMGFGELMSDTVTSGGARDQLTRLLNETRRMKRITDNLLRFSRQSSWDSKLARLAPVVQEVLTLCEYYTRYSKVSVEVDIAPDLPPLAINEDEIKQVLLNLFNNSCDALQGFAGLRQIKIRAYRDRAFALIQVQDSGPGFSNLDRALDPFYTTKPVGKGTGLGLSVCHRIAKRRGGDLRIENIEPHGGLVTLQVPLVGATPQPATLQAASAHA